MKIKILGTESLGVRGLSCVVETAQRKIVFDPGLALGYRRHHLLPHPLQVAVGKIVRGKIQKALEDCTDVVFSHFHGDHIPLADPNPFQMPASEVSDSLHVPRLWCKSQRSDSASIRKRCQDLSRVLDRSLPDSQGLTVGPLSFSQAVPHGEADGHLGTVMMTRVEDSETVFVHASDIQLLETSSVQQILDWEPDVVLASGPPLYLSQLSRSQRQKALNHARLLARDISTLILDHHLLRSEAGFRFLEKISVSTNNSVTCAADYMGCTPLPLEAWRTELYEEMPVPQGWHEAYYQGEAGTEGFQTWRGFDVDDLL